MKNILLLTLILFIFSCDLDVVPDDIENVSSCDFSETPFAKITTNATTCEVSDCTISFDASTSTNACTYQWDVDGNLSTIENETATFDHTFTTVGLHTVTLWVENNDTEIHSTQVVINVVDPNSTTVTAFFTVDSLSNNDFAPATAYFTNGSANATSYEWDFGDGSAISNEENPNHLYTASGTYVVKLKAIGATTDSIQLDVVIEAAPVAEFEISSVSNNNIVPSTVVFNNTSTNANIYEWNFGDGSAFSNEENPSHLYNAVGTFTITLKAGKAGSSYQDIYQKDITIEAVVIPDPISSFTMGTTTNNGCAPTTVSFNNTSTNATSYEWNFGDGSPVSTVENPSHTYTEGGNFIVTLKAINAVGVENISTDNVEVIGVLTFGKNYGGNSADSGKDIVQNSSGGYAILGTKDINGSKDITLTLTDKNGNVINDFTFGAPNVNEDGVSIITTQSGGYAIIANMFVDNSTTGIKLWILNENGGVITSETHGTNNYFSSELIQKDNGDFVILSSKNPGPLQPCLIFTNSNGAYLDEQTYDLTTNNNTSASMILTSNGELAILANSFDIDFTTFNTFYTIHLLIADLNGNQTNNYSYTLGNSSVQGTDLVETSTGGFAIVGNSINQGAQIGIHLLLIDGSGNNIGEKQYGVNQGETSGSIIQTQNGFAILGSTNTQGSGMYDFYLMFTNSSGTEISSTTFGGQQDDFGGRVIRTQDGGLGVLGTTSSLGGTPSNIYFVKTDADGNL